VIVKGGEFEGGEGWGDGRLEEVEAMGYGICENSELFCVFLFLFGWFICFVGGMVDCFERVRWGEVMEAK